MKLHFLWRENYIDYLWASSVTASVYFIHSGILLYESGVLTAYATPQELLVVSRYTAHLINDPQSILGLRRKFDDLQEVVTSMEPFFFVEVIEKTTNKELYKLYIWLINILRDYIKVYKLTDPHYIQHLENTALGFIRSRAPRDNPEKIFTQIIEEKNSKILARYGFTSKEAIIIKAFNTIARVRFEAKKIDTPLAEFSERLLREVARRTYLAVSQISNLGLSELKGLLVKGREPDLGSANRRHKRFALRVNMNRNPRVKELSDTETRKLIEYDRSQSGTNILKGTVAYPGKVSGTARIAPALSDSEEYTNYIATLRRTDILIAAMTTPRLTMAFSKIAAVVTDEGGLMSHAALIAREQKVPCVVGTKIATRVLLEGEKITVDADKGIVIKNI